MRKGLCDSMFEFFYHRSEEKFALHRPSNSLKGGNRLAVIYIAFPVLRATLIRFISYKQLGRGRLLPSKAPKFDDYITLTRGIQGVINIHLVLVTKQVIEFLF